MQRHPLIPNHVEVLVPQSKVEADDIAKNTRSRFDAWVRTLGPWPEAAASLDLKTHSERGRYHGVAYRELEVTYLGEPGEVVPAYLLIPTTGKPPYPAVVAQHQCFQDCDIGKDAVVGRAHLRPDQAYGFELVLRGYVVLAPDSVNCGARNLQGVRAQGENNRDKPVCWDRAIPALSVKSLYLKHLWDAVRALDVLSSLEIVDCNRIGMIGHSLGAGTTFWAAAYDQRIKAAVASCHFLGGLGMNGWHQFYRENGSGLYYHDLLALVMPRALLATRGTKEMPFSGKGDFQDAAEENAVLRWCFDLAKHWRRLYGVPEEGAEVRFFEGGHAFPDDERAYALKWLEKALQNA